MIEANFSVTLEYLLWPEEIQKEYIQLLTCRYYGHQWDKRTTKWRCLRCSKKRRPKKSSWITLEKG